MEKLIELIFSNIYIVIAVVFFLYKLFGGTADKKKKTGMPTFGGEEPKKWFDQEDDVSEESPTSSPYHSDSSKQTNYETKSEPHRTSTNSYQAEHAKKRDRYDDQRTQFDELKLNELKNKLKPQQMLKQERVHELAEGPRLKSLQSQDLKQAVIWSEILGQPRAKRPYRR